jgi:peptidoglycan/LPS O-acetylase OafA/YrhL
MAEAVLIVLYIVFCLLTGLCGSQRRMGFFGTFIVSLFITPVLMLLILVFTAPRDEQRRRPQGN